jgi:hypothetical protein
LFIDKNFNESWDGMSLKTWFFIFHDMITFGKRYMQGGGITKAWVGSSLGEDFINIF